MYKDPFSRFWALSDRFEVALDLGQWLVGWNSYDFIFNLFLGPFRLGIRRFIHADRRSL
jgi:hypothetical protein